MQILCTALWCIIYFHGWFKKFVSFSDRKFKFTNLANYNSDGVIHEECFQFYQMLQSHCSNQLHILSGWPTWRYKKKVIECFETRKLFGSMCIVECWLEKEFAHTIIQFYFIYHFIRFLKLHKLVAEFMIYTIKMRFSWTIPTNFIVMRTFTQIHIFTEICFDAISSLVDDIFFCFVLI